MTHCPALLPLCALLFGAATLPAADPASSQLRPWTEYRTILWIGDTASKRPDKLPLFYARLREMGINAGMVYHDAEARPLLENGFAYYVENIINRGLCLKFNSRVTDWEQHVTSWSRTRGLEQLQRDYCLDDPAWREWANNEMARVVRKNAPHHPFAYDIRDELSVTISANPFDYDFSAASLEAFRAWLREHYGSLDELNREWQTAFSSWGAVRPFTTDQIKARLTGDTSDSPGAVDWAALRGMRFDPIRARDDPKRWNFAPWADFRSYMDVSLAGALAELRDTAHKLDPQTPVGIEGTQMPAAFGGYDLWRLSQVLDWVEPYDIGNAREIFGSFMPGRPILTTVGEGDARFAARRLWHLLLLGDRGCLVWWSEDCVRWSGEDYELTAKGRALAPVLREMTSPLAQLLMRSERETDPIAIQYSQASIQADWLIESIPDGATWLRRFSSFEADHNRLLQVRNSWLKALQDAGYSPQFLSSEQIERGALGNFRVLVLPGSLALSDQELGAIQRFVQITSPAPRAVLFDGVPGLFDAHGRLRQNGAPEPFARARVNGHSAWTAGGMKNERGEAGLYSQTRMKSAPDLTFSRWVAEQLAGVSLPCSIPLDARIRIHRFRLGEARLIALERNVNYQMSEALKQAGGNEVLETPADVALSLAEVRHVYDLRKAAYLGHTNRVTVRIDPWRPTLLALLPGRVSEAELLPRLQQFIGSPSKP